MRKIEQTGQFRRDYKREARGAHRQKLASDFIAVITALANALAEKHRDHALTGDWRDHRGCHVRGKIAKAFGVTTNWLLFENGKQGADEDFRLQFKAMGQLTAKEKEAARAVLEGLLLKHIARQWGGSESRLANARQEAVK